MKIVADENISFAEEAFSNFGDVKLMNGRKIDNSVLTDADVLIVRSITNVNKELLENTNVKFVGTATIGTDHIDIDYLNQNGIVFTSASGCNSYAVTEYVFTAISNIIAERKVKNNISTIGIVGFGNIGKKVARYAEAIGLQTFISDPPLERAGNSQQFFPLEKVLDSDIITFHVPLNLDGPDKTLHLLNEEKLNFIKPGSILINSSRGPVIDNEALLRRLNIKNDIYTVLDVWEKEPDFIKELLKNSALGTPHIAGYSLEGKVNGTKLVYDALCSFLGTEANWIPKLPQIKNSTINLSEVDNKFELLNNIFNKVYSIEEDDLLLRNSLNMSADQKKEYFDNLRKTYKYRRELDNYEIVIPDNTTDKLNWLKEFRINVINR